MSEKDIKLSRRVRNPQHKNLLINKIDDDKKLSNVNIYVILFVIFLVYIFVAIPLGIGIGLSGGNEDGNVTSPTPEPTISPTSQPTSSPSSAPTNEPTRTPTRVPIAPIEGPTSSPTSEPTVSPTPQPTTEPTNTPTRNPSNAPTDMPTIAPTNPPTMAFFNTCCEANAPSCSTLSQEQCVQQYYLNQVVQTTFPCEGTNNPCTEGSACCVPGSPCTIRNFEDCISVEEGNWVHNSENCNVIDCPSTYVACCFGDCNASPSCFSSPQTIASCANEAHNAAITDYITIVSKYFKKKKNRYCF